MRDLITQYRECIKKLNAIGIYPPVDQITSVTVNTRATGRYGQTSRRFRTTTWGTPTSDIRYTINIAAGLLMEENPVKLLEETIIHELLHTMPNCFDHGKLWQHYAEKVNQAYGYAVSRVASCAMTVDPLADKRQKYAVQCDACNHTYYRQKISNVIAHPEKFRCTCGGHLRRIK